MLLDIAVKGKGGGSLVYTYHGKDVSQCDIVY